MRDLIAIVIVPVLKITGYRFSKLHRQNETIVYKLINTVKANNMAGW